MATDQIPEQVYEEAARANTEAVGAPPEDAARVAQWPNFRAVVESAYRAGQRAMLDYVSKNADVLSIHIPVTSDRYHAALAKIRDPGETKEPGQ